MCGYKMSLDIFFFPSFSSLTLPCHLCLSYFVSVGHRNFKRKSSRERKRAKQLQIWGVQRHSRTEEVYKPWWGGCAVSMPGQASVGYQGQNRCGWVPVYVGDWGLDMGFLCVSSQHRVFRDVAGSGKCPPLVWLPLKMLLFYLHVS